MGENGENGGFIRVLVVDEIVVGEVVVKVVVLTVVYIVKIIVLGEILVVVKQKIIQYFCFNFL